MIGVLTCVRELLQLLLTQPLRVSVREVVSALQRGRGPAQSHSQVLLPGLPGLETLRAHAEVRSCTRRPEKLNTNKHPSSAFFFYHVLSAVDIVQLLLPCSPPVCVHQQLSAVDQSQRPFPPHTLIISVSADLIWRLKASDVFGFAFDDDGVTLLSSSCRQ